MSEFILIFIIGGLFSGFTAGLFGIGGGSFLIPLFLFLLPKLGASPDQLMHQAVATSLAIIIPTTMSASYKQYMQNNIDKQILKIWIPCVCLGLLSVIFIFTRISSTSLQIIFINYLCACAIYMLVRRSPSTPDLERKKPRKIPAVSCAFMGFFVGILSILLGLGGGTVTVPYFSHYEYPLKKAIAISSVTGLFVGVIGTFFMVWSGWNAPHLARYSLGYVNGYAVVILSPFCMVAANYGAKISNRLKESVLKVIYVFFLLSIALFVYFKI